MNLRWLNAALGCAVAILSVCSRLSYAEAEMPGTFVGTVTLCDGTSSLIRGDQAFRLVRAAGIRVGDSIKTDRSAQIALSVDDGPVVMIGAESHVKLIRTGQTWEVNVLEGEARCIHDGESACRLLAGKSSVALQRAIIQLEARRQMVNVELIAGSAILRCGEKVAELVADGLSVHVDAAGMIRRGGAVQWDLQPEPFRLASAIQTAPVLEPPPATVDPPVTTPEASTRPDEAVWDDAMPPLFDEDEDEELLGLDQAPVPAVTRTGRDDAFPDDDSLRVSPSSFAGSSSLSLGSFFGSTGSFTPGFANNDANQQTFQGMLANGDPFPGAIHLVTGEQRYDFDNVTLTTVEAESIFPGAEDRKYYSIGQGALPTGQVLTNFFTGTGANPVAVEIPRFGMYLLHLDQYNYPDPADPKSGSTGVGITGLLGNAPTSPTIVGATPLADERSPSQLNPNATFALGEFLVEEKGSGIVFAIRRSDQDRLIVKDPGGNDAKDLVTPHSEVTFTDEVDPRFLPQSPTVKEPDTFAGTGTTLSELKFVRRAAFTTLVADQLQEFSRRTGQTRFVVDGKIVDISGFQPSR